MVDLPLPDAPTRQTIYFSSIFKLKLDKIISFLLGYLKFTFLNSILPFILQLARDSSSLRRDVCYSS